MRSTGGGVGGHNLAKMTKNFMKITKSEFWGKNNRGNGDMGQGQAIFGGTGGEQANFGGKDPPSPPLLGDTMILLNACFSFLIYFA